MMSTRALGLGASLRKAAFSLPKSVRAALPIKPHPAAKLPSHSPEPVILRNVNGLQRRAIQTTSMPASKTMDILNQQRLRRPSSPHFTIYQPQLTWIGSIANRITGVSLSVLLYGFSLAYLIAPGTFDSAHVVEFVGGLPDAAKYAGKTILAAPFAFHSFNGLRHLAWDMGKLLTVKACYTSGYAVLGATAISTLALVFYV